MTIVSLESLGYNEWHRQVQPAPVPEGFIPARVTEVHKNSYTVSDGIHEMSAELSGKFLFDAEDTTAFPTTGDWVTVQTLDNFTLAIIHAVLPRATLLKRKEAGKRIAFQLIAANIDVGLIVQSAEAPNYNLLDRYCVMLHESGIQPMALFSKADLLPSGGKEVLAETLTTLKVPYLLISSIAEGGLNELSEQLITGKTYCLLGQSGVGKTSLLNRLLGADVFKVNAIRETDGRGRHTTVRRQLSRLDSGGIFIDTPGMRELGNFEVETGLEKTFDEFGPYAASCRYRDCTHTFEDGCAVIAAVENGEIEEGRYRNYQKLRKEAKHYELSYHEKRKKDKSFGKMVKNYKKFGKKR